MSHRRMRAFMYLVVSLALAVTSFSPASAIAGHHPQLLLANIQVSHDAFLAHSEPMLAQNPANPRDLVGGSKLFTDIRRYRFKIGTYRSTDGGLTWRENGPLPGYTAYRTTSDISLAFAPDGRVLYACVLAVAGRTSGIFVSRSFDGGRTWVLPVPVFYDNSGKTFSDKPWIAVDTSSGPFRGRVYVAWNLDANTSGDPDAGSPHQTVPGKQRPGVRAGVAVAWSSNRGKTFSPPVIVDRFKGNGFALGAIPAVNRSGRLYIVFLRFHDSAKQRWYDLGITASGDGGRTFSPSHGIGGRVDALPVRLPHGTFRNFSLPAFAISPRTGSMLVTWADMRHGDADIMKIVSHDGGRTWSLPARVNDDPLHDGADQFQPQVAVTPNGLFACSWFDRRYDPRHTLIDVVAAVSTNDGRTFGPNLRITTRSWNPAIDAPLPHPRSSTTFIGDYQGLAADNTAIHPFWNDTQNGRTQEIRTATVPLSAVLGPQG